MVEATAADVLNVPYPLEHQPMTTEQVSWEHYTAIDRMQVVHIVVAAAAASYKDDNPRGHYQAYRPN